MERDKKTYKVLSMCDFCSKDAFACQGNRIYGQKVLGNEGDLDAREAVIACDAYVNPVAAILESSC